MERKNRRGFLLLLLAMALLVVGVTPAASASGRKVTHQKADVYTFDANEDDVGNAHLFRTPQGVYVAAAVRDGVLQRGDTVTLWWVVWNDWENCPSGACGTSDDDFADPDLVGLDLGYANGEVVRRDGRLFITAWLGEGPLQGFPGEYGITSGDGLIDAQTAEIHIVIRHHGPRQPGYVGDQIGTFMGGCDYTDSGLAVGSYGAEGAAYPCFDSHFSVFAGS